jgi:hypothetical protein
MCIIVFMMNRCIRIFLCTIILFFLPLIGSSQSFSDLDYMRIASDVARNLQRPSLVNYYGWTIDAANWHGALDDNLFGPFLAAQEEKPGRVMGCVIAEMTNNDAICVYFQDDKPYGYVAIKVEVGHHFTNEEVKSAFNPITPDLLDTPGSKAKRSKNAALSNPDTNTKQTLTNVEYVRIAANVAYNSYNPPRDSIDYYSGYIIDNSVWQNASSDSLFGPFLAAQVAQSSRVLVCVMSELSNDSTCLYFQDQKPYGYVSLKVEVGHKFTNDEIKNAYKPITPELLQKRAGKDKNKITEGQSALENGTMIPADIIMEGAS